MKHSERQHSDTNRCNAYEIWMPFEEEDDPSINSETTYEISGSNLGAT